MSWWDWPPVGGLLDQELVHSSWTTEPAACSISCPVTYCSVVPSQLAQDETRPLDEEHVAAGSVHIPGWRDSTCGSPHSSSKLTSLACTVSSQQQPGQTACQVASHALSFGQQSRGTHSKRPAPSKMCSQCSRCSGQQQPASTTRPLTGWISLFKTRPDQQQVEQRAAGSIDNCSCGAAPHLVTLLGTDMHAHIVNATSAYTKGSTSSSSDCSSTDSPASCPPGRYMSAYADNPPRVRAAGTGSSSNIHHSISCSISRDDTLLQTEPMLLAPDSSNAQDSNSIEASYQQQAAQPQGTGWHAAWASSSDGSSSESSSHSGSRTSHMHPLLRRAPHPLTGGHSTACARTSWPYVGLHETALVSSDSSSESDSDSDSSGSSNSGVGEGGGDEAKSSDSEGTDSDATSMDSDHRAWRRQQKELLLELQLAVCSPDGPSQDTVLCARRLQGSQGGLNTHRSGSSNKSAVGGSCLEQELQIQVCLDSHTLAVHNSKLSSRHDQVLGMQGPVSKHVYRWLLDSIAATEAAAAAGGPSAAAVLAARVARLSHKLQRQCLRALRALRARWVALGSWGLQLSTQSCSAMYSAYLRTALSLSGGCMVRRKSVELVSAQDHTTGLQRSHKSETSLFAAGTESAVRKLESMEGWSLPTGLTTQHPRELDESGSDSDCSSGSDVSLGTAAPTGVSVLSLTPEVVAQLAAEAVQGRGSCVTRMLHDNALMRVTAYAIPAGMRVTMRRAQAWPCTLHVMKGSLTVHLPHHHSVAACSSSRRLQVTPATGTIHTATDLAAGASSRQDMAGDDLAAGAGSRQHTAAVAPTAEGVFPTVADTSQAPAGTLSQEAELSAVNGLSSRSCDTASGCEHVSAETAADMAHRLAPAGEQQHHLLPSPHTQQEAMWQQSDLMLLQKHQQSTDSSQDRSTGPCQLQATLPQTQQKAVQQQEESSQQEPCQVEQQPQPEQPYSAVMPAHRQEPTCHASSRAQAKGWLVAQEGSIVSVPQGVRFAMACEIDSGDVAQGHINPAHRASNDYCTAGTVAVVLVLVMKV